MLLLSIFIYSITDALLSCYQFNFLPLRFYVYRIFFFFFFIRRLTSSFESFGLLNDVFPFYTILDTSCPIFYVQYTNILYYIFFPSLLGSSFGSCSQRRPFENLLGCSKVWHPLYMSEPAESEGFNVITQFIYLHLLCYLNTMPEMKHSNSQLIDIPLMQN